MASLDFLKDSSFLLFLAPPAWGKTRLIEELWREGERGIVFVSPLRALAKEVFERFKKQREVFYLSSQSEWFTLKRDYEKSSKPFLILTAETLSEDCYESLEKNKPLFVLDEFHLFYLWGQDFRPKLWETAMEIALRAFPCLALSATMNENLLKDWQRDFALNVEHLYLLNLGNERLLHEPESTHFYFSFFPEMLRRRFITELLAEGEESLLYFCSTRHEVDEWMDFCLRRNILALGCKGGEVEGFMEALKKYPKPRVIFATSALSHGVNLPSLAKVFISYPVGRKDLWLQMVARGGRQGEKYDLFTMDAFGLSLKERGGLFLKGLFRDILLRWRLLLSLE